jgi:hypothetical protein
MSMFFCKRCDFLRDSDDGCEEVAGHLVCADCLEEAEGPDEVEEQVRAERASPNPTI